LYSISNPDNGSVWGFGFQSFSKAKLYQLKTSKTFNESYSFILSDLQSKLNETQTNYASRFFGRELDPLKNAFSDLLKKQINTDSITIPDAKQICQAYTYFYVYKHALPIGRVFFEKIER